MSKITRLLQIESDKLKRINNIIDKTDLKNKVDEILWFVEDLKEGKIDLDDLENNFLTPTLIFLWMIEKLYKSLQAYKIGKCVIKLEFSDLIMHNEFIDYFQLESSNNDEIETSSLWDTITMSKKTTMSKKFPWMSLVHQEIFENEDDTDDWMYHLVIEAI